MFITNGLQRAGIAHHRIDTMLSFKHFARMFALAALASILGFPAAGLAQHPGELSAWKAPADGLCAEGSASARARCLRKENKRRENMTRASRDYHAWLADRLAADGGARNLALAANLRALSLAGELFHSATNLPLLEGDARLVEWVGRASRDMRGDQLVHMLLIRPFSPQDEARVQGMRDAWRDADPANLASLRDDDAAIGALLETASERSRLNVYVGDLLLATLDAVERHPPDSQLEKVLLDKQMPSARAYALSLAFLMLETPRFSPALHACKGDALLPAGRREACVRYGTVLADASDTLIAHMIGLAILRNAATDDAGRERIEERRRRAGWLLEQWTALDDAEPADFADEQAAILRTFPGIDEMAMMRQMLEANGIPVEPPVDYRHVLLP